jgi:hypothetical protein
MKRMMKLVPIVLAVIALALAGMAGANYAPMISEDPLADLAKFDENVTLQGWGKINQPAVIAKEPSSMESATDLNQEIMWTDKYFNGSMESATTLNEEIMWTDKYFNGSMESATTLNWKYIMQQPASVYDGRGISSVFDTAGSTGRVKHKIS